MIAHNKTLAAQLCNEFREFFPDNAVEYFVSYYDYYQPEAYVPAQDLYIEKDSSINDEIDRLRHAATASLFARRRRDHRRLGLVHLRDRLAAALPRADAAVQGRGLGRPRRTSSASWSACSTGATTRTWRAAPSASAARCSRSIPAYAESAYRIQLFGDEIEAIQHFDPLTGEILDVIDHVSVWPASHYVTKEETMERAVDEIEREMRNQVAHFEEQGKQLEAHRLQQRTRYDMEMMQASSASAPGSRTTRGSSTAARRAARRTR